MIRELSNKYIVDAWWDVFSRSYIIQVKDEEGNEVDVAYAGNMEDRDALVKQFVDEYDEKKISSLNEAKKKKRRKKNELPALDTLHPLEIFPDYAKGIDAFNKSFADGSSSMGTTTGSTGGNMSAGDAGGEACGMAMGEDLKVNNANDTIYLAPKDKSLRWYMSEIRKYKPNYSFNHLYKCEPEARPKIAFMILDRILKQKELDDAQLELAKEHDDIIDNYKDDNDLVFDGDSFWKNGIEFESDAAEKEYFGEEKLISKIHEAFDIIDENVEENDYSDIIHDALEDDLVVTDAMIQASKYKTFMNLFKAMCEKDIAYMSEFCKLYSTDMYSMNENDACMIVNEIVSRIIADIEDYEGSATIPSSIIKMFGLDENLRVNLPSNGQMNESFNTKTVVKKSLRESLAERDSRDFRESCKSYELESLVEANKSDMSRDDLEAIRDFAADKRNSSDEVAAYIKGRLRENLGGDFEQKLHNVKMMHEIMLSMNDENAYDSWIYTMPDEPSEDDFAWFAEDEDEYAELLETFDRLYNRYCKYGLYKPAPEAIQFLKDNGFKDCEIIEESLDESKFKLEYINDMGNIIATSKFDNLTEAKTAMLNSMNAFEEDGRDITIILSDKEGDITRAARDMFGNYKVTNFRELEESCEEELKEDFWNPCPEFNEFTTLERTFEDEFNEKFGTVGGWNSWNQEQRDEFALAVSKEYLKKNPNPSNELLLDLTDCNYHTERRALEKLLKNKFNESYEDDKRINYMLLDRLQSDCDYFLGNGNGYEKHLWAGNITDQILKMKELYNSFPDTEKPEWITLSDIDNYEKQMDDKLREKTTSVEESCTEDKKKKTLNEGPGAGYSVHGEGYINSIENVKITEVDRQFELQPTVSFTADIKGFVREITVESYDDGGELKDVNIPMTAHKAEITLDINYGDNLEEELLEELRYIAQVNTDFEFSTMYGAGWFHIDYDGTLSTEKDEAEVICGGDTSMFMYDAKLNSEEYIDCIGEMSKGAVVQYDVVDEDGELLSTFNSEEDAVKYAKENILADRVIAAYVRRVGLEDYDYDDFSETVWDRDNLEESYIATDDTASMVNKLFKEKGFVLDDDIKHANPAVSEFGKSKNWHWQIKKPEMIDSNEIRKEAQPLIDALHKFEDGVDNGYITWNFGLNKDGYLTAGVDLRVMEG